MKDFEELNDIYDGGKGAGDPDPVKPPLPKGKPAPMSGLADNPNSSTRVSHYDPAEYNGYLKGGLYENQGDPNLRRGAAQSAGDKWVNMLAGLLPKFGTSLVEGIGYMGAALSEFGDDRDYSNPMTEWAKEATRKIDEEWFPMYRKSNDTFAFGDAAWWTQNIQGLAVSAGSFAVQGIGLAKLFGTIGKGAQALNAGRKTMAAVNKGVEILTSGALAYTEGAMMGKSIYDKTYDTQLKNHLRAGKSLEEADALAKHTASQSAATTVQLNTVLNTFLNMEMLSGAFAHKNENLIRKFWEKQGGQAAGETLEDFGKRIRTGTNIADKAIAKQVLKNQGAMHYLKSSGGEGIEELTNLFAERTGEALGQSWDDKTKTARTKGLFDQFGELSHYFERTMDKEGALSFALGAVGGVAQSSIIDNIALHKVTKMDDNGKAIETGEKDAAGNKIYETQRVSARNKGKYHDRLYFNNVKDAIISDIDSIEKAKAAMGIARAAGQHDRAEAIQDDLLDANNYNAVHMGMAGNYAETFREMAKADNKTPERAAMLPQIEAMNDGIDAMEDGPDKEAAIVQRDALQAKYEKAGDVTEAMRLGLAKDMDDNEYKKKAETAISSLSDLEKIHAKIQQKYGREDNPAVQRVADAISSREMTLYSMDKRIKRLEQKALELKSEEDVLIDASSDVTGYNKEIIRSSEAEQVAIETQNRYAEQAALLRDAKTALQANPNDAAAKAVVNNLIKKYHILGMEEDSELGAVAKLEQVLIRRHRFAEAKVKESQDVLYNTTGYNEWAQANPDKKFEDLTEAVGKKHQLGKDRLALEAFLEEQRNEYKEGSAALLELKSEKGTRAMVKKSEALHREMVKKTVAEREAAKLEDLKRQKNYVATEEQLLRTKNRLRNDYVVELKALQQEQVKLTENIEQINAELNTFLRNGIVYNTTQKGVNRWHQLKDNKENAETRLARVKEELIRVETLFDNLVANIAQTTAVVARIREGYNNKRSASPVNDTNADGTSEEEVDVTQEKTKDIDNMEDPMVAQSPVVQSAQLLPVVEAKLKAYEFAMKLAPVAIQNKLVAEEQRVKQTGDKVSLDFLKDSVDTQLGGQIMLAMREYIEAVRAFEASTVIENATNDNDVHITAVNHIVSKIVETSIEDDGKDVDPAGMTGEADSLVLSKVGIDTTEEEDGVKTIGRKTEKVIKINTLALEYVRFFDPVRKAYRTYSLVDRINEHANTRMIKPKGLTIGTKVILAIDTNFSGVQNYDDDLVLDEYGKPLKKQASSKDFLTVTNDVDMDDLTKLGDVPIKIMTEDGEILGWLPRMGWVTAQMPGTEGAEKYTNVQGEIKDAEGNVTDNMAIQKEQMMAVRKAVAEAHNKGRGSIGTTIDTVGAGTAILNNVPNLNTETARIQWESTAKLLPRFPEESSLTLAIIKKGGNVYERQGHLTDKTVNKGDSRRYTDYDNLPVVLLPGYNGEYVLAPLMARKIWDEKGSQGDFNTIVRAIEIYIGATSDTAESQAQYKKEAADVKARTKIDILTTEGLRNFINQYFTYTHTHFNDSTIAASKRSDGEKTVSEFLFKIEDAVEGQTRGNIKIGTTYTGRRPNHAKLINGKLDPKFVSQLLAGIGGRYKNVNFQKDKDGVKLIGINTPGKFTAPIFRADGVWAFTDHDSYNDFIKANTKTNVVGTNVVDGKHIYTVHPAITLDVKEILNTPDVQAVDTTLALPGTEQSTVSHAESMAIETDDWITGKTTERPPVKIENVVGQDETAGTAVSMKSLQDKYNFTPASNHNGKTVAEVFEDMQRLGIPYIAAGYNPFSRCI